MVNFGEVLHRVGADGVGVKFPIFAVNCCCLPLSFGRRREKRRKNPKKAKKSEKMRKKKGKITPTPSIMDLLMALFRGAVFRHGGVALKQPIKQPTETPTSTLALMGRFPSLMGRFPSLMGRFHRFRPKGPFFLLKIHWKTAHQEKGH